MYQNVMTPQPTIILIFIVEERQRTIFPGVPEANRRPAQENDEPIAWMDQENFGEFVFLWHNLPSCLSKRIFLKSFLQSKFTQSMEPQDTNIFVQEDREVIAELSTPLIQRLFGLMLGNPKISFKVTLFQCF